MRTTHPIMCITTMRMGRWMESANAESHAEIMEIAIASSLNATNAESHAEIMEMRALASSLNATIASLQSADLSNASILSAYHGLDQLPAVASVFVGSTSPGRRDAGSVSRRSCRSTASSRPITSW